MHVERGLIANIEFEGEQIGEYIWIDNDGARTSNENHITIAVTS